MGLYVHFSSSERENEPPRVLGPYDEFVQLTYNLLRSGPDGDPLATVDADGFWRIGDEGLTYTDIVVSARKA